MPDGTHLLAFLLAASLLAVIPGPGMLYVLARTLADGTQAGIRSAAGTAVGGTVQVLAAAAGLSTLLTASSTAFDAVRIGGAAYLIWLGVQTLRSARDAARQGPVGPRTKAFTQGVLTEAFNPKTTLFFLTFLPQFVQQTRGPAVLQLMALGLISVLLNSGSDVLVARLSGRLGGLARRSPRWQRWQRIASGSLLMGLGGAALLAPRLEARTAALRR